MSGIQQQNTCNSTLSIKWNKKVERKENDPTSSSVIY